MLGMMIGKRIIAVEHCVSLAVLGRSTWVMEGGSSPGVVGGEDTAVVSSPGSIP